MMPGPRRVAVSGASGFIGRELVASLAADGWEVHRLVRRRPAGPKEISWEPARAVLAPTALDGFDAVVHLAGESLAGVWTPGKKRKIMESRVRGTALLAETIARSAAPPRTFVTASGVNYYGDSGDRVLTESSPPGDDFLARVCVAWERAAEPAAGAGVRVVHTRSGIVLHPSGGALRLMSRAFRLGLGARLGSGRQWLSWIALEDAVRVLRFVLDDDRLRGGINVTAPEAVRNEAFTRELARAVRRPAVLVVPAVVLSAVTGGMGDALLLASVRAAPAALLAAGFAFAHPTVASALRALDAGAKS
jgi:uncharacterized protein